MKCPICSSEIPSDAVVCTVCGATQVTKRSPQGVIVGWVGMTVAILMAILWAFVVILPVFDVSLKGFPWLTLVTGTIIAVALLWYSRSTLHTIWVRRGD